MEIIKTFEEFKLILEGKESDVKSVTGGLEYRKELFPSYNSPKKYVGKKKFKYRVLAKEGDKVKTINFGSNAENYSRLNKKYWENSYK